MDGIRFGRMLGVGWRRSEATPALLRSAPLPPSVGGTVVAATGDQQATAKRFCKPSVVSVARRRWRRVNATQRSDGHGALAGAGAGVAGGGATTTSCVACGETNGCVTVPLSPHPSVTRPAPTDDRRPTPGRPSSRHDGAWCTRAHTADDYTSRPNGSLPFPCVAGTRLTVARSFG